MTRRNLRSCVPNRPAQRCSTAWSTLIRSRAGSPRKTLIGTSRITRDGFRGPINWYRSIDRGIELTRHLAGSQDHAAVPLHDRKSGSHERASRGCHCQRGAERTQSARQRRTSMVPAIGFPSSGQRKSTAALLDSSPGSSALRSPPCSTRDELTWPQEPTTLRHRSIRSRSRWSICRLTERWFREGFGLLPAGGSRALDAQARWRPMCRAYHARPRPAGGCWAETPGFNSNCSSSIARWPN